MQVAFEPRTHNFFSVSKDKYVKYWDGDKVGLMRFSSGSYPERDPQFELIQKMDGHHGSIWALAASRHGGFIVTGSHDKSIRVWEKTDDPLFLEEEREKELEQLYEGGIADALNREDAPFGSGVEGSNDDGTAGPEATVVQKHTTETLMAGERIIEALELADGERDAMKRYQEVVDRLPESEKPKVAPPPPNAVLTALQLTPAGYVLRTVERVPTAALYDALLVLPFSKVTSLLRYMDLWASQVSGRSFHFRLTSAKALRLGHLHDADFAYSDVFASNTRIANCRHSFSPTNALVVARTPEGGTRSTKNANRIQPRSPEDYSTAGRRGTYGGTI